MNSWFAAGNHNKSRPGGSGFFREGEGLYTIDGLGFVVRMPSAGGVAPGAVNRAAIGADKEGGPPGMAALSLKGVKTFVYGKLAWHACCVGGQLFWWGRQNNLWQNNQVIVVRVM